ncbi:MAG: hypothetical protein AAB685_02765 [Patescibacteria group bacterium]
MSQERALLRDNPERKRAVAYAQLVKEYSRQILNFSEGIRLPAVGVTEAVLVPSEKIDLKDYYAYHKVTLFGLDPTVTTIILRMQIIRKRAEGFIQKGIDQDRALDLAVADSLAEIFTDIFCKSPEKKEATYKKILRIIPVPFAQDF